MSARLGALAGAALWAFGCSGATQPLPGGPPPEYEPPRPFDAGYSDKPAAPEEAPVAPPPPLAPEPASPAAPPPEAPPAATSPPAPPPPP